MTDEADFKSFEDLAEDPARGQQNAACNGPELGLSMSLATEAEDGSGQSFEKFGPSTSPEPVKRRRDLACSRCHRSKVKCDGVRPTCSRCNRLGFAAECAYPRPLRSLKTSRRLSVKPHYTVLKTIETDRREEITTAEDRAVPQFSMTTNTSKPVTDRLIDISRKC